MTTIRLKGELDFDLTLLGFKEGDVVHATIDKQGRAYFSTHLAITVDCVVWPENYEIC